MMKMDLSMLEPEPRLGAEAAAGSALAELSGEHAASFPLPAVADVSVRLGVARGIDARAIDGAGDQLRVLRSQIDSFEREVVEAQQAAYMETCVEDDEIAERMDAGRRALLARGDNEVGPYQSPMEDGMRHFHQWYRAKMAL